MMDPLIYALGLQMGYEVERSVTEAHNRAVADWNAGMVPMAHPPASPIIMVDVA